MCRLDRLHPKGGHLSSELFVVNSSIQYCSGIAEPTLIYQSNGKWDFCLYSYYYICKTRKMNTEMFG